MYLVITLTKQVEALYNKTFKTFKKKSVKISEDRKISHTPGSEGFIQ